MNYKHGLRHHPLYSTWKNMKARCYIKSATSYKNYGARGITVCDRWKNDFAAFLEDMGERPEGCSLDRIDNNGPYSPENCKWSTPAEQVANRRPYTVPSKQGEKHPMAKLSNRDADAVRALDGVLTYKQIAEIFGVSRQTVGDIINGRRRNPFGGGAPAPAR